MTDEQRDTMLTSMSTDIKWIKDWIKDQNKFKLVVYTAVILALIGLIV